MMIFVEDSAVYKAFSQAIAHLYAQAASCHIKLCFNGLPVQSLYGNLEQNFPQRLCYWAEVVFRNLCNLW